MKILNLSTFLFFLLTINQLKIKSNVIFPGPKSDEEKACINVKSPSVEGCRKIRAAHRQDACCLITWKGGYKCGYLENTEFGLKIYKHLMDNYDDVEIKCQSSYLKGFKFIFFSLLLLFKKII